MKVLADLLPVILFFIAYKTFGMSVAIAVLMVATVAQMAFVWFKNRRLETSHWITLVAVLGLGGATLLLHDDRFIKWKPSIVYWVMAIIFFASSFVGEKKTVVERLLGSSVSLPANVWKSLNWSWIIFFIVVGFLNLAVAFYFYKDSTDAWVNFKLFGLFGITLGFTLIQGVFVHIYSSRNKPASENAK